MSVKILVIDILRLKFKTIVVVDCHWLVELMAGTDAHLFTGAKLGMQHIAIA